MLRCIFNHLHYALKTMNFITKEKSMKKDFFVIILISILKVGHYSLILASGTNRSYIINYVYKNMDIELTMMNKVHKIFIGFKIRKIFLDNIE